MKRKRTKKINWNKELKNLGVDMDATIARRLGVTPFVVWKKRQELGIPRASRAGRRGIDWEKERKKLGVEPDADIAERLGVTSQYVRRVRQRLGIPHGPRPKTPGRRRVSIEPNPKIEELTRALGKSFGIS